MFTDFKYFIYSINLNKLRIKDQLYLKSRTLDAFEQKIRAMSQSYRQILREGDELRVKKGRLTAAPRLQQMLRDFQEGM